VALPYCGAPPDPAVLLGRWNLDPVLLAALAVCVGVHVAFAPRTRRLAAAGWMVAALALVSPLCALSVSLFAARVAQHLVLGFAAAPLLAAALPGLRPRAPWSTAAAFAGAMWLWHLPAPYALTLRSTLAYWAMHLSIFGSALLLWSALIVRGEGGLSRLAAGTFASAAMGLLGALLALAGRPWFAWHELTAPRWGLSPLADQQLGGLLMWVPGSALFLWLALRETHDLMNRKPATVSA